MLFNRTRPILGEKLGTNQNGFRPGRSTLAQILTLRRIIEEVKSKTLPAVMIFVDFHEAFNSIHRGKLMKLLKTYSIPLETLTQFHFYMKKILLKLSFQTVIEVFINSCRSFAERYTITLPVHNSSRLRIEDINI